MSQNTTADTTRRFAIGQPSETDAEDETLYGLSASSEDDTERQSVLVLAVEHVFPSAGNRIVYEADVAEDRFPSQDGVARLIKPVGNGLSAALGLIGARDRLGQDHSVVLVANPLCTTSILDQLEQRDAGRLRRCVIVAPVAPGDPDTHSDRLRRFEARGGRVLHLTSARNLLALTAGLQSAARHAGTCIVFVDVGLAPRWQVAPETRPGRTARPSRESIAERVLLSSVAMQIARFTRSRHDATPVLFHSGRPWQKLRDEFGRRALAPSVHDLDESIAWCAALAQGGCHPIVVLTCDQLSEHLPALRQHLFSLQDRITLIVLDSATPSMRSIESLLSPLLAAVQIVVPGTPDEVVPLTKAALCADGPRLLYLPTGSDLFSADRDRWLDFRSAAALRERAGQKRVPAELPLMLDSPEREARLMMSRPFTPIAQAWLSQYDAVGRGVTESWRRLIHVIHLLELPCVAPEWRRTNRDTKFLAALFNALLAAPGEERECGNLLGQLLRLPPGERLEVNGAEGDTSCVQLASDAWNQLWQRAAGYPRFQEFADLLLYDFRQLGNTMEYSELAQRQPEMINPVEHAMYSPHGMMVNCAATLDLMCSPRFDASQLGPLREALWHSACMSQYANLLAAQEAQPTEEMERELLNRWQLHRASVLSLRERAPSCHLRSYVEGLDRTLAAACAVRSVPDCESPLATVQDRAC